MDRGMSSLFEGAGVGAGDGVGGLRGAGVDLAGVRAGDLSEEVDGNGNVNADGSMDARRVRGQGQSQSQSLQGDVGVGAGFVGYPENVNRGMGYGFNAGIGVGSGIHSVRPGFREREQELEINEVVLEGPLVSLKESLLTGRFSDLTIFHGVRVWNAHKVVVCSQSEVLESMIDNNGVGNMFGTPSKSSILNLSSFPLDSITALIEYLYTSAYSLPTPADDTTPTSCTYLSGPSYSLPLHEQIFYLAVHLQIPALETLSAASFRHTLNTQISNLDIYFSCIKRIFNKTTDKNPGLRNVLLEAAVRELDGFLGDEGLKDRFWGVMRENREFWEGVLRLLGCLSRKDGVVRDVGVPLEVERVIEKVVQGEGEEQKEWILCADCGPTGEGEEYESEEESLGDGFYKWSGRDDMMGCNE
ncbi:d3defdce-8458-4646-8248-956475309c17 [Sclerotinia trifoliorum]|uniref:D3defdce-8458-4646-8248-956475309c17 n=1 Tax=Sclerotinia trifoliorum TaxID=28548 RepID=A0A8H2VVQ1_9HELO|nr:d3defdce-8458-4646-8248-956475309c17 [Sclerotinia trifoliorum]